MNSNTELEALSKAVGEDKAKKIIKLTSGYDKYIAKFKKDLNDLINPIGFEVMTGISFVSKVEIEARKAAAEAAKKVMQEAQLAGSKKSEESVQVEEEK